MRAPDKLPQEQLDYYADPQSAAALANGVLIKWLVEVIDRGARELRDELIARRSNCRARSAGSSPEGDGGHG
jgi:hypothetical protein